MTESMYKNMPADEMEELLSNFLISSWSYSKVTSFSRNEKAFEMNYIYGERNRQSATSVAGNAYHAALDFYFKELQLGNNIELPTLEKIAFEYIDDVPANNWKLQKTTPAIEDCIKKATVTATALLKNFIKEAALYTSDIEQVLEVESYFNEFLVVNGVEIPMPCHAKIDLVLLLKDGKKVVVDHKSKATYSDDQAVALSMGVQACTYFKCYEAKTGEKVDEVWFVENKHSQNKDGSAQLKKFRVELNENTVRLYEALLYEPLKRMIAAVSDPDYVYLINDSDNFVDKAELYDFWAKTQISEIEDFNVADAKKDLVARRLKKIRDTSIITITPTVIKEFKANAAAFIQYDLNSTNMKAEEKIEHALRSRGTVVSVKHKFDGYSSDTFLLEASAGVNIASIYGKKLDIANALDVPTVRISRDLVVHEGKSYLGVEVSKKRERDLIFDPKELNGLRIPLGKDNFENTIVWDIGNDSTSHMLVCGATGSGKSVLVKTVIEYGLEAGVKNLIIFDPKFEFTEYNCDRGIEVANEMQEIEEKMQLLVDFMDRLVREKRKELTLVVFDEFADAVGRSKGLESLFQRLLQKGRSCGIRIVGAMQRASTKVLNGDAKANFPVQVCFRVPKAIDSKVVLDEDGAETLAGKGDGLIKSPEYLQVTRFQAYFKP